jgi:uncharacterized protein (TIGR03067 family)
VPEHSALNHREWFLFVAVALHGEKREKVNSPSGGVAANGWRILQQIHHWHGMCDVNVYDWYRTLISFCRDNPALMCGWGNLGSESDPPSDPSFVSFGLTDAGRAFAKELLMNAPSEFANQLLPCPSCQCRIVTRMSRHCFDCDAVWQNDFWPFVPSVLANLAIVEREYFHCCGLERVIFLRCTTCRHVWVECCNCRTWFVDLGDLSNRTMSFPNPTGDPMACPACKTPFEDVYYLIEEIVNKYLPTREEVKSMGFQDFLILQQRCGESTKHAGKYELQNCCQPSLEQRTMPHDLHGPWKLVTMHDAGRPPRECEHDKVRFRFYEGYFEVLRFGHTKRYRYETDDDAQPRGIDLVFESATLHGTYWIKGDVLTICLPVARPKSAHDDCVWVLSRLASTPDTE